MKDNRAGNLTGAKAFAYNAIKANPGKTCRELEAQGTSCGQAVKRGAIQKRVLDLAARGHISKGEKRTCNVTGKASATWHSN